ncbi:hypothetical protein [Caudoviricetes sp.]|nr:hypothetical protein [Caudoviricetes sp.]
MGERAGYQRGEMERVALATANGDLRSDLLLAQRAVKADNNLIEELYAKIKELEREAQWEYTTDWCAGGESYDGMGSKGLEGWELAAVTRRGDGGRTFYYKRPLYWTPTIKPADA